MQGQSRATIDKERRIGSTLSICMRIAAARFGGKGYNYWHADLNAGSGVNELIGVPGSPLVFFALAEQFLSEIPPLAFFAERDRSKASQLLRHLNTSYFKNTSYLFPYDNEEVLQVFAECIRSSPERNDYVVGTILVDPNGWFYRNKEHEGPPLAGLEEFVNEFPKIDLVLNLNVRTYQMMKGHHWGQQIPDLKAIMRFLKKQHWLLGRVQYGGDRFVLAVGRNISTGPHTKLGMHLAESPEGQEIIEWSEDRRQGRLLF